MPSERQPMARLLGRGLLLHCPRCGEAHLFGRWIVMAAECPRCGHRFEREQGYWLGAVIVNTAVTLALFIAIGIAIVSATWPDVPWTAVLIITLVFNGIFPLVFYPFSKTIWVALDLSFRPLEPVEVTAAHARLTRETP